MSRAAALYQGKRKEKTNTKYFDNITKIIRLYQGGRVSFMKSPKKPLIPILLDICLLYASHQQSRCCFTKAKAMQVES